MKTRNREEAAETLALEGLTFLAASAADLARFVDSSGLDPAELRARAGEPAVLRSVLDFLLADDERLLAFCGAQGIGPKDVHVARHALDGSH